MKYYFASFAFFVLLDTAQLISITHSIGTGFFRVYNETYIYFFCEVYKESNNKQSLKKVLSLFLPLSHDVLSACTHSVQFYGNVSPHVLFQNPGMSSYTHTDLLLIPKK